MDKSYHDETWLRHQYETLQLSWNEIAESCGVGGAVVRKFAKRFNIASRAVSDGNKLKWRQTEYKQNAVAGIKAGLKANREKRTANSRKMWAEKREPLLKHMQSEEYREKQRIAQQLRMLNPAELAKAAATLRRCRSDKVIESRRVSSLRATLSTPTHKSRLSNRSKSLWATARYRAKTTAAIKAACGTDAARTRCSLASSVRWMNANYRKRMTAIMRKIWTDTKYRGKQAAGRAAMPATSILEKTVRNLLASRGVEATQLALGPWTFDLGFTHLGRNILIECQGSYWHQLPQVITRDRQKKTYFERYLSDRYELYYIYEYQFYGVGKISQLINTILGRPRTTEQFEFTDLTVNGVPTSDVTDFLNSHHYLGNGRSGINVAAYLGDKLIACCRYGGITRLQTADRLGVRPQEVLELNRLCIHPAYHKRNLASWFLARTLAHIPAETRVLMAFSDEGAGHTGAVYKAAGWRLDGRTKSSYWYVDGDGHRYHKKSVWDQARRLRSGERDYAAATGLVRIEGKPVSRFVKWL